MALVRPAARVHTSQALSGVRDPPKAPVPAAHPPCSILLGRFYRPEGDLGDLAAGKAPKSTPFVRRSPVLFAAPQLTLPGRPVWRAFRGHFRARFGVLWKL